VDRNRARWSARFCAQTCSRRRRGARVGRATVRGRSGPAFRRGCDTLAFGFRKRRFAHVFVDAPSATPAGVCRAFRRTGSELGREFLDWCGRARARTGSGSSRLARSRRRVPERRAHPGNCGHSSGKDSHAFADRRRCGEHCSARSLFHGGGLRGDRCRRRWRDSADMGRARRRRASCAGDVALGRGRRARRK
jgi:hypothetical protein